MKFRSVSIASVCMVVLLSSCSLDKILGEISESSSLSEQEVIAGLREALTVGTDSAASRLGRIDGYLLNEAVKIFLPSDVAEALSFVAERESQIRNLVDVDLGFIEMRDDLLVSMNRAAEEAASESVPVFVGAIQEMTIADGFEILNGSDTAATRYLHVHTYDDLSDAYTPIVDRRLSAVGATQIWNTIAEQYNTFAPVYEATRDLTSLFTDMPELPVRSLTTDLSRYTTEHALDGLFYMVGREERNIREDPLARVTDLLEKVFGSLDS
ncbi:MAG: DUF4197 domain-containing protein [Chitinivibrionales bacterium]